MITMTHTFNENFVKLISRNQNAQILFFVFCLYIDEYQIIYLQFLRFNVKTMSIEFIEFLIKYNFTKKRRVFANKLFSFFFAKNKNQNFSD